MPKQIPDETLSAILAAVKRYPKAQACAQILHALRQHRSRERSNFASSILSMQGASSSKVDRAQPNPSARNSTASTGRHPGPGCGK